MSNGNGTDPLPVPPINETIIERLSTGRRVSVDGIDVGFDSITEIITALKFVKGQEALKTGGAFSSIRREIAVPPGTNGGHRLRFPVPHQYRRGF